MTHRLEMEIELSDSHYEQLFALRGLEFQDALGALLALKSNRVKIKKIVKLAVEDQEKVT